MTTGLFRKSAGYRYLDAYVLANVVELATCNFCNRFLNLGNDPGGAFLPNTYGCYDMAGNLFEWCWDWYDSGYCVFRRRSAWSRGWLVSYASGRRLERAGLLLSHRESRENSC